MIYPDTTSLRDRLEELRSCSDEALSINEKEELAQLEDIDGAINLLSNEPLILDTEFTEYTREVAQDFGIAGGWPYSHIDWESAADELRADYVEIEYLGQTYLVRS